MVKNNTKKYVLIFLIILIVIVIVTIMVILLRDKKNNIKSHPIDNFVATEHKVSADGNKYLINNFENEFSLLQYCGNLQQVCKNPLSLKKHCMLSKNIYLLHNSRELRKTDKKIWAITDVKAISKVEWNKNITTYRLEGWIPCSKNRGSIPKLYANPFNTNGKSNPEVYLCLKYEEIDIEKDKNKKILVSIEAKHFENGISTCPGNEVTTIGDIPKNLIAGSTSFISTCYAIGACTVFKSIEDIQNESPSEYLDSILLNYISGDKPQIKRRVVSRLVDDVAKPYHGIDLKFPDKVISAGDWRFKTQNEKAPEISFGDILCLAGDLYGIPDEPITPVGYKHNLDEEKKRFERCFETMNHNKGDELKELVDLVHANLVKIEDYLKEGKLVSDYFASVGHANDIKYNQITGGGSDIIPKEFSSTIASLAFSGRYLKLATKNYDHFCEKGHAYNAFLAGHTLAMEIAKEGNLQLAYAYCAFACHFLSDHFAAGHLRVPREDLPEGRNCSTLNNKVFWFKTAGNYCSKIMHDEDNDLGLAVASNGCYEKNPESKYCHVWRVYGDAYMFDPKNHVNVEMQKLALQQAVDEVWKSYDKKEVVKDSKVHLFLPNIDETKKIPKLNEKNEIVGYYDNNKIIYKDGNTDFQIGEYSSLNHTPMFLSPELETIKKYLKENKHENIDYKKFNCIFKRVSDGIMTKMASPVVTALEFKSSDSYFPGVTH